MPSAQDCLAIIRDAAGGEIPDDVLDELLTELQQRADARRAANQLETAEEAFLNAADEVAGEVAEAAQIERRNRLINVQTFDRAMRLAAEADEQMADPSLALEAMMVGVNAPLRAGRLSVDARGNALLTEYMGGLIADLRMRNLLPLLNSRTIDREIAQELAEMSKRQGSPGVSGSDPAVAIAKAIDKYRRVAVARENRAGAWIKPLEGYIVRQSHDMHKMRRAGFEAWRDRILPLLDAERTFKGADAEKFLKAAYDGLVTGIHIRSSGAAESDLRLAFKGPANLARKISEHRVLHFRGADAWFDYNAEFGRGTLMEAVLHEFERAARNTALMEVWGPNPRAMFDRVKDALGTQHRGDAQKTDRLRRNALETQFREIDGTTRIPISPTGAQVSAGIRAVQSMSKLGAATLSAVTDHAFMAGEFRAQGASLLDAWGKSLTSYMEGVAPGQRRETAELIGVGLDGMLADAASRWSAQDDLPGRVAGMQRMFFKLNLLGPDTDAKKRGFGLMMARDLAMQKGRGWDGLPEQTRAFLRRYDVDAAKWDVARQAVRQEADGRVYLMPDAISDLPDEAFSGVISGKPSARAARRARDELETALRAYYTDRADFATPTPGARERAILRQGTQPGTPAGEALRFVTQFKAFPITVLTKPLGRDTFGGGARTLGDALLRGQGDMLGLANMIVSSTILGYLAMSAKEMAKGRSPRDPFAPETWVAALTQGGGLGIYGDFLFGEYNRFGRSLTDTLAGPTFGTASDIADLYARVIRGEDAAAGALRFVMQNTPFINLFYTRAALDYLVFYQIQEALNPGFLRRMERRVQRENGQTFVLPPSQAIPRGGGERLLEGVR